jgi:hypothetical protein
LAPGLALYAHVNRSLLLLNRSISRSLLTPERRFGARFHHELAVLHPVGLQILVRRAKVTVVIGECLITCPTSGYWGDGVYSALRHGAFVLHNSVEGLEAHFTNNTHLVYFDAVAGLF